MKLSTQSTTQAKKIVRANPALPSDSVRSIRSSFVRMDRSGSCLQHLPQGLEVKLHRI